MTQFIARVSEKQFEFKQEKCSEDILSWFSKYNFYKYFLEFQYFMCFVNALLGPIIPYINLDYTQA